MATNCQCQECLNWIDRNGAVENGDYFYCKPCHVRLASPKCPNCGSPMILKETARFTYHNGQPRKFWACPHFPACRATHGAHPDGQPLGIPADNETKQARMKAHDVFDQLWKTGVMSRGAAYRKMQQVMGMTVDQAHIAKFNKEQCEELIRGLLNKA